MQKSNLLLTTDMDSVIQTSTTYNTQTSLLKQMAVQSFGNKPLESLRTPAFVVDRAVFARNCATMHKKAQSWGARFRAHVKTHKVCLLNLYICLELKFVI